MRGRPLPPSALSVKGKWLLNRAVTLLVHDAGIGNGRRLDMRAEHDATMLVRAALCERLETLQRLSRRRPGQGFIQSVQSIRRLAPAYGLTPVVRLAEALDRAAAGGRPGTRREGEEGDKTC